MALGDPQIAAQRAEEDDLLGVRGRRRPVIPP
jgi:hypothetical protein